MKVSPKVAGLSPKHAKHPARAPAKSPEPKRGWLARAAPARVRGDGFADPPPPPGSDTLASAGAASTQQASADLALRHQLASAIVKPGGSGTAEDAAAVVAELEKLPVGALKQLQKQHTQVIACRGTMTDYATDLRGVSPRGWPPGATWDQVPGAFLADRNKVVVATIPRSQTDPTRIVPPSGQGHGSVNLVLHETGHSLDYKGGRASSISRTDKAFIAAYNQDKAGMEPYFQQPPPAGPEEAFAETLALHYSGNPDFATAHPALAAYWNEHPPFGPGGGPS